MIVCLYACVGRKYNSTRCSMPLPAHFIAIEQQIISVHLKPSCQLNRIFLCFLHELCCVNFFYILIGKNELIFISFKRMSFFLLRSLTIQKLVIVFLSFEILIPNKRKEFKFFRFRMPAEKGRRINKKEA